MGAGRVIVIDSIPERLRLATEFGADDVIDLKELPDKRLRVQRVRDLTAEWGRTCASRSSASPAWSRRGWR